MNAGSKFTQYACAVLLILSSIALAFSMALRTNNIESGVLLYIAQAFLLAGSIFGLDYYVKKLTAIYGNTKRDSEQQSSKHTDRELMAGRGS